jgi:thiol-disulfide isomerase/thioredoxin
MRRVLAVVGVLLSLTTLVACNPHDLPTPHQTKVDVDTPQLRQEKQQAGVETCVPGRATAVSGGLPAVTLPCLGGGPDVDLSRLRGPLVVSLWAQSCGPCRQEMPILQGFHEKYGDRVGVVGVDYLDTLPGLALGLMQETGATYPSLADPLGTLSGQQPLPVIRGLPYLLFVGKDGRIDFIHPGQVHSQQELVGLVRDHLGVDL